MLLTSKRGAVTAGVVTALLIIIGISLLLITTLLATSPDLRTTVASVWSDLTEFISTLDDVFTLLFGQKIGIAIKIFVALIAALYVVKLVNVIDWG